MSEVQVRENSAEPQVETDDEESGVAKQHVSLEQKQQIASETTHRLFELLGTGVPHIDVRAEDGQIVIGLSNVHPSLQPQNDTRVLESLQFILQKAVNRFALDRTRLSLDTDGFRRRRPEGLDQVALALAEKAQRLGKTISVGPLGQGDLRFMSAQLQRAPGVQVLAHGAPERRRLVIAPQALIDELAAGGDAGGPVGQNAGGGGRRRRRRR